MMRISRGPWSATDAALCERGQGTAHGLDRERQIICYVIACDGQRDPVRSAAPYALLQMQKERSDLLLCGCAAEN